MDKIEKPSPIESVEDLIAEMTAVDPNDSAFETFVREKGLTWKALAKMGNKKIDALIAEAGITDPAFNDKIYSYSAAEMVNLRD